MPSKPVTSALGLYRTPNPLGGAQDGGYRELKNCVIRSKDTIEPRLGQTNLALWLGSNINDTRRINALFSSSIGTLAQYGSGSTSGVALLETLGTAILSDVDPPSAWLRTKFADCMKRCYFTSDGGLKRVDSSGAGAAAGGKRCKISTVYSHPVYSTSGFLGSSAAAACMYRAELISFAPDGAEIVGPPSNRFYARVPENQTLAGGAPGAVNRVSNVITVTTPAAHNLRVGDAPNFAFHVDDDDANEFTNGTKTIATVPSSTTFTINETAADYTNTQNATLSLRPASVSVRVLLPSTAALTDLIRLYRSEQVEGVGGSPSDDVYQVFEKYLTSTDLSNGYVTISDNTPEVLLGDPAYFSPSVEGEGLANETPVLAHDVCSIGDQLFAFNLLDPHTLEIRLIATGGSTGLVAGVGYLTLTRSGYNTLSVAYDNSFNAAPASGFASGIVYSGGTVARDIEATALAICDAINFIDTNNWLDAFYISGIDEAPGKILLRCRDFATTAFTAKDDTYPGAWAPRLPTTGTLATSRQVPDYAGVAWSKNGQPDAWPALNRARVGSPSEYALRGLALRDKIICLKEKSAHLLTPSGGAVRIDPLDDTCEFPLPDTADVLDNQVFCLSSIGVVSVSEGGVANMGSPIEGDMRPVIEQAVRVKALLTTYSTLPCLASWGCADEVENRYLLAIPSDPRLPSSGTDLAQAPEVDSIWVYNASGRAWSGPWPQKHRHAAAWRGAAGNSRLVFARYDKPGILKEVGLDSRAVLLHSDYLGETRYVSAVSGTTVTLAASSVGAADVGTVEAGDALYVSSTGFYGVVTSVTSRSAGTVVVHSAAGISAAATVLVLKRIPVRAEPVMQSNDSFPQGKQVTGFNIALSEARFQTATVYMGSERSGDKTAKVLSRPGFSSSAFGSAPFGDGPGLVKERGQAPKGAARGDFHSLALVVEEAGAFFKLHSFALDFEVGSPKGVR